MFAPIMAVATGLGITGYGIYENETQKRRAERRIAKSNELAERQLDFNLQQYEEWKSIFGDLQKNLADYYTNLGTDKVISMGLEAQQTAHQKSVENIRKNLARRGLSESQFEDYTVAMAEIQNEYAKGSIKANAEPFVMQQKAQFLQGNLAQGNALRQSLNQAYGQQVGSYMQQGNTLYNLGQRNRDYYTKLGADLAGAGLNITQGASSGSATKPTTKPKTSGGGG